jgi:hypothetical protein
MDILYIKENLLYIIFQLAEMPGVARDSIRNEGTREINYSIMKNNYNLQMFLPPEK